MRKCPTHFKELAEKQEGQRIQRFPELDTIIDMANWWIMWIIEYMNNLDKEGIICSILEIICGETLWLLREKALIVATVIL
ncbi:uncharacterized protein BTUAT1_25510 [Bacillus altitudinis]|nr:uncharacterized protein BTUAT1_25510 [Bacillus pumilus]